MPEICDGCCCGQFFLNFRTDLVSNKIGRSEQSHGPSPLACPLLGLPVFLWFRPGNQQEHRSPATLGVPVFCLQLLSFKRRERDQRRDGGQCHGARAAFEGFLLGPRDPTPPRRKPPVTYSLFGVKMLGHISQVHLDWFGLVMFGDKLWSEQKYMLKPSMLDIRTPEVD